MSGVFDKGSAKSRRAVLMLFDIMIFAFIFAAELVTGVMKAPTVQKLTELMIYGVIVLVCMIGSRLAMKVYHNALRYAIETTYLRIITADLFGFAASILLLIILQLFGISFTITRWMYVTLAVCFCVVTISARMIYQMLYRQTNANMSTNKTRVAIVGAGQIGCLLADELRLNPHSNYEPVLFIDNNPVKVGGFLRDMPVYAENSSVFGILSENNIQELFIAITSIDGDDLNELMHFYANTNCKIKLYGRPSAETDSKNRLREIKIEDLLFRKSIAKTDSMRDEFYREKIVLVTGSGSIGSELCRQIARRHPKRLIVLDIYENNAYDIQQELKSVYGTDLDLCVEIASVRDRERMDNIFNRYRPDVVFHAAAHKHVPLMEDCSVEAIKNNVLGTYNTADMAEKYGVERFIMISTDKAVNPTNIMGASKRMCEMIVQSRADSKTCFSCVRFGNVLGSNGSVVPLFAKQIEAGGPVTITDKRIIRYFMTIPEAVQLIMTAGVMANSGEIFVLDMGKPIKILDLAESMITLSGLVPYRDIEIREVGLRPGEKLYEELLIKNENIRKTDNDLIFVEKDTPLSRDEVDVKISELTAAIVAAQRNGDYSVVRTAMKHAVPTFCEPDEINVRVEADDNARSASMQ